MKIVERKFKKGFSAWVYGSYSASVCNSELRKLFTIPRGIERIWLSIHDCWGPNRVRIEVDVPYQFARVRTVEAGVAKVAWVGGLDRILKPLVGETIYMQCEYEA